MARAKPGPVQIRHTLLDAEGLNSYWIDSVVTLELKPSASSKVCLICTGPGLALAMPFLHSFHL